MTDEELRDLIQFLSEDSKAMHNNLQQLYAEAMRSWETVNALLEVVREQNRRLNNPEEDE